MGLLHPVFGAFVKYYPTNVMTRDYFSIPSINFLLLIQSRAAGRLTAYSSCHRARGRVDLEQGTGRSQS